MAAISISRCTGRRSWRPRTTTRRWPSGSAALAERLSEDEERIVAELADVQGEAVDIGGYYRPDPERVAEAMRPSPTLNAALASL